MQREPPSQLVSFFCQSAILGRKLTVKVTPLPIQLVDFKVNGQGVLPRYIFNVSPDRPTVLTIAWKLEGSSKMQVELLPAPGTVPPTGQTAIPLPPEASEATNPDGSKLTRSFVVQTIPFRPPKKQIKISLQPCQPYPKLIHPCSLTLAREAF